MNTATQIGIDLFEDYQNIPENLQRVLNKHVQAFEDGDYKLLHKALKRLSQSATPLNIT